MRMYLESDMPVIWFVSKAEFRERWEVSGTILSFGKYFSDHLTYNGGSLAPITVYPHPKHERLYLDPGSCEIHPSTYYCDRDGIPAESMRQYFDAKESIGGLYAVGTHSDIAPFLWD